MKIILRWQTAAGHQDAESYIRVIFAHITDKIRIVNVASQTNNSAHRSMFSNEETIVVDYDTQGLAAATENIKQIIEDAVSLRGGLQLVSIEVPPVMRVIEAICLTNDSSYIIDPNFARFVAAKSEYRQKLQSDNVESVKLGYEMVSPNQLRFTGRIATQTSAHSSLSSSSNPYHCFAIACQNALAQDILSSNIVRISMTMNAGGMQIQLAKAAPTETAAAAASSPAPRFGSR
jgi:hypothetical protein